MLTATAAIAMSTTTWPMLDTVNTPALAALTRATPWYNGDSCANHDHRP